MVSLISQLPDNLKNYFELNPSQTSHDLRDEYFIELVEYLVASNHLSYHLNLYFRKKKIKNYVN